MDCYIAEWFPQTSEVTLSDIGKTCNKAQQGKAWTSLIIHGMLCVVAKHNLIIYNKYILMA